MIPVLVDDRYVYQARDRWLDIATGETTSATGGARGGALTHAPPEVAAAVDRILRAADLRDAAGVHVVRLALPDVPLPVVLDETARAVRSLGFVAIRSGVEIPESIRRGLLHRHMVLFACESEWGRVDADRATCWIRALTAASPRAHLLVLFHQSVTYPQPSARAWIVRERAVAWAGPTPRAHDPVAADEARSLIAAGELSRAESVIHSAIAEAAVRGERAPAGWLLRRAELRFWQGRFEEAAGAFDRIRHASVEAGAWSRIAAWAYRGTALRGAPPPADYLRTALAAEQRLAGADISGALDILRARLASRLARSPLETAVLSRIASVCLGSARAPASVQHFVQRSGARGILRWGVGRDAMNLLQSVSTLLQLVQEADDEFTALRHGCSWVREHASADAAAIVASDGTKVIAGDGVAPADLEDPDLRASFAPGRGRTIASGSNATVTAPMRYAGATIGFAIVWGRRDAAESLGGAAAALASACAPALRARLDSLWLTATSQTQVPEILGRSPGMAGLREAIARAAGTTFPVLIEGESGTGKELVARAVHRLSARRDRRFAALNCAALADELVEAELFGHSRGAFTGAVAHRAGLFEESHGSTLFLDEVTELSPRAQAKLLRVLQEREIRRVGEHVPRPVDVRVVAATNVPIAQAVSAGRFREDLLFRLAVVRLRVPPLRDRVEDVPLLAQTFWRTLAAETGKRALLAPDAVAALCRHTWPGNVRELQNVIAGLIVAAPSRGRVAARHVQQVLAGQDTAAAISADVTLDRARQAFERRTIAAALARHGGCCARAARELGLSRQGLAKAMKRLGLEAPSAKRRLAI